MRTLVYDVAADSGGAATVLQSFYEEFKKDTENEYIFVLSVYKLPETDNIKVLNFPEVKKSMLHRLYFDHFVAHKLVKKYKADRVLSLQNLNFLIQTCRRRYMNIMRFPFRNINSNHGRHSAPGTASRF